MTNQPKRLTDVCEPKTELDKLVRDKQVARAKVPAGLILEPEFNKNGSTWYD